MFDNLTLNDLYELHTQLWREHRDIWQKMSDPATGDPLIQVLSDQWMTLGAKMDEVSETCAAVYAEIQRRERETSEAFRA
jgi:hypothetical protein